MFTNNGLQYLASSLSSWNNFDVKAYDGSAVTAVCFNSSNSVYPFRPAFMTTGTSALAYSGSLYGMSNGSYLFYGQSSSSTGYAQKGGVIIGDGDATPDVSDYCLSGNQITNFSASTSINSGVANGQVWVKAVYNITNTGVSAFTIKEIGVTRQSSYTGTTYKVLMTHDVLEVPVTIDPGEAGIVVYNMTYNLNYIPS